MDGNTMDVSSQNQQLKNPRLPKGLPPPNSKTPDGRQRLGHIVSVAIEVATSHGHLDQVRAIQQLYEQSKKDTYIAELMDVVLAREATTEQYSLFQKYMRNLREGIQTPHMPETAASQRYSYDQGSLGYMNGEVSFTTADSGEGTENGVNRMEQFNPGGFQNQFSGRGTGLGFVLSGHQSMAGSSSAFNSALHLPEASQIEKLKGPIYLRQRLKAKAVLEELRGKKHPGLKSRHDSMFLALQGPETRGVRSSKRLKMMREEIKVGVIQHQSSDEEVVNKEEDANTGQASENQSLFVETLNDRDFLFRVIDGCIARSTKAGYPEVGQAIKNFYNESLVNPTLEGFFESLITGRIGSESVIHFQKYVRKYVLDSQKVSQKSTKPAPDETSPIHDGNELGSTASQHGNRERKTPDLKATTTPHSSMSAWSDSSKRIVDKKITTDTEASPACGNQLQFPATTMSLDAILAPHAGVSLPPISSPHMAGILGTIDTNDSYSPPTLQPVRTTSSSSVLKIHELLVENNESP